MVEDIQLLDIPQVKYFFYLSQRDKVYGPPIIELDIAILGRAQRLAIVPAGCLHHQPRSSKLS